MPPINDADVKLMLAIIGSAENTKTDNEKLANIIGGGTTANAIRQRVAKIKNQAKAVLEGNDSDIRLGGDRATPKKVANGKGAAGSNDEDDGQATPSKKRAAKGKGKGTPRGKKAKEEVNEEDGYGGESGESPGKRMKMEEDTELADEDAYSGA